MSLISKETIQEVKNRLIQTYNPLAIYIFGSYAWGMPTEDSDLDLLIVIDSSNKKSFKRSISWYMALSCLLVTSCKSAEPFNNTTNNPYLNPHLISTLISGSGIVTFDGSKAPKDIHISGITKIKNSNLDHNVHADGYCYAYKSTIPSLHVNGRANISSCVIQKETVINGSLYAKATSFNDIVSIKNEQVLFENCAIAAIEMREPAAGWIFRGTTKQIVRLKKDTHVYGSIVFRQEGGEVWLYDTSSIHGSIIGGTIVYKGKKIAAATKTNSDRPNSSTRIRNGFGSTTKR
ncbi:MAG: hypothetical protein UU47_C0005G0021 [candidate division TM6 bacterium GW2011_GWE2_41_16]|nr:MAG: hypothetical protein UU47_C0005G0021 [candidate division TM6 bacterium GW2011_GWE2_41_16]